MTEAVVWLVVWFACMVAGTVIGQIMFVASFGAITMRESRSALLFTIPALVAGFGFAAFSLVHVILQIIDIFQRILS